MKVVSPGDRLKKRLTASTQAQSLVLLASVAMVGAPGLARLGDAQRSLLTERSDAQPMRLTATAGSPVQVGSRANASVLSNLIKLASKAERRMEDLLAAKPYRVAVEPRSFRVDPAQMIPEGLSAKQFEQRLADVSQRVRNGGALSSTEEIVEALGGSTPLTYFAADVLTDARNVQRVIKEFAERDDVWLRYSFPNDVNFDATTVEGISMVQEAMTVNVPFFRADGPVGQLLDGYKARRQYFDEVFEAAKKGRHYEGAVPESFGTAVMNDAEFDEYLNLVEEIADLRKRQAVIKTGGPEWEAALTEAIEAYRPEVQEDLRIGFRPLAYRELAQQSGIKANQGLVFYGPPGTGKTFLAKALANLLTGDTRRVRVVRGGELTSKYVGETGQNILALTEWAQELAKADPDTPVAIVLDEIDALLPDKTATSTTSNDLNTRGTALAAIEELLKENPNVLILGASNNPTKLDSALIRKGRIGTQVEISAPDTNGIEAVFRYHLRELMESGNLADDVDVQRLAKLSGLVTFAEIEFLVDQAKRLWFNGNLGAAEPAKLSMSHLRRALESLDTEVLEPPSGPTIGFQASLENIRRANAARGRGAKP